MVELVDYDALGLLVQEQGAVAGKAYPELGFALIRLGPETDPARGVEFLGVDPRVLSAELQFAPAIRRPAIIRGDGIPFRSGSDTLLSPAETKDSFSSNLFAYTSLYRSTEFSVEVTVVNSGLARSEPASLRAELVALVPDESTADPDDRRSSVQSRSSANVPAIDGKGSSFSTDLSFATGSLEGGQTYYLQVLVEDVPADSDEPEILTGTVTGFTLDSLNRIQHVCVEPGRGGTAGVTDPLLAQQWHLDNTGQTGYAETGGVAGEDLQMDDVLDDGPTGGGGRRPSNANPYFEQLFSYGVHHLRSGLGAIYVKAAGNGFGDCASLERLINERIGCVSSIADDWQNLPYLIVTGAFNADGRKASYASAGPNLWITAPAGEYGSSRPALLTVDQMGTDRGIGILRDDNPLQGEAVANPYGDYTGRMNGTSASAPLVSGAVAVLLETEPALTWRDVKHILAKTARKIDPDIVAVEETIGTIARTLRLPWTENAAGYAYHDWYGFGALDLDAAVEMAEDYTPDSLGEFRQSGWFESGLSGAIPDNDGTGLTRTLNVSSLPDDANIEAVLLEVDIDHDFPNDLGIHLVSPQGTRAVLNQVFNETLALDEPGNLRWRLLGNAFYGETPNGDWQIEVFDAAEDDTGDLDAWRLRFYYGSHPEEEE